MAISKIILPALAAFISVSAMDNITEQTEERTYTELDTLIKEAIKCQNEIMQKPLRIASIKALVNQQCKDDKEVVSQHVPHVDVFPLKYPYSNLKRIRLLSHEAHGAGFARKRKRASVAERNEKHIKKGIAFWDETKKGRMHCIPCNKLLAPSSLDGHTETRQHKNSIKYQSCASNKVTSEATPPIAHETNEHE